MIHGTEMKDSMPCDIDSETKAGAFKPLASILQSLHIITLGELHVIFICSRSLAGFPVFCVSRRLQLTLRVNHRQDLVLGCLRSQ